jgi:hypothetical protein
MTVIDRAFEQAALLVSSRTNAQPGREDDTTVMSSSLAAVHAVRLRSVERELREYLRYS